jgi:hypothetical protein
LAVKIKYSAALLAAIAVGSAAAQAAEKPFRAGAGLGYTFSGYREETYSPVNRYLNALTFLIDGSIEKGNFFHSLNIGFFMGKSELETRRNR